eukprot:2300115-Prymnesium_polylepis.3
MSVGSCSWSTCNASRAAPHASDLSKPDARARVRSFYGKAANPKKQRQARRHRTPARMPDARTRKSL